MRRLLSTFANGSAGLGLLVLRLGAGVALIVHAVQHAMEALLTQPPLAATLLPATSIIIGILLSVGLWTPYAGVLLVVDALWHVYDEGQSFRWIMFAAMGGAVALLGPGAWSIDARRFGWRRVDLRNGVPKDPPPF